MSRLFFLALVLLIAGTPSRARGQSGMDLLGSARAAALAGAVTGLAGDTGGHANPAARGMRDGRVVTFFARQLFGMSEMRYGALHYVEPTRWGALSGSAGTFGFEQYREVHLDAGYARGLSLGTTRRFFVGLTARYHHTTIRGYGQAGALGLNAGALVHILASLDFGVHATNVNGAALAKGADLPQTLAVGLSYVAERRLRVVVDAFKDIDFPLSLRAGLEVYPVDALALRAGVGTAPTRFTAGTGIRVGHLTADLAAEQHWDLGWSPSASLGLRW